MVKKKTKEKEEEAKPAPPVAPPQPSPVELHQMQVEALSATIKSLTDTTERMRKENDTLRTQFNDFKKAQLNERENDKDIMEFLKIQIGNKQKEIIEYESRLRASSHESDVAIADLQTQLHVQKDIAGQTITSLQNDLLRLRRELDDLSDFKSQKADIENELEDMKIARENDRCLHKEKLYEAEREVLREKDKLLKEKEQQVKEIRENLLNLSKAHLDKTTKLTIMENDQITSELAFQAKQTMEMIDQNKKLTTENIEIKRTMELMAQTERDLSKKNSSNQKTIKSLQTKIQELEDEVAKLNARVAEQINELQNERNKRDLTKKDLEISNTELASTREAFTEAKKKEEEEREEIEKMKVTQSEIMVAVRASFDRSRQNTIDSFMQAEADYRLSTGFNIYELSEKIENIVITEKDIISNFITERINPKEPTPVSDETKRASFPPIRAISTKTDVTRTPRTPMWDTDTTGKIYIGFSAPLPPATKNKRQLNKLETTTNKNKETVSIGVQTESVEKNIFLMDKWMKENRGESPDPGGNRHSSKLPSPSKGTRLSVK